ncbi:MAG: hypothetical protein EPO68_05725 [Planctomycetota bacterium]|nr:MAG: hypothetical protein EPO68_05725 [Planctomycetota bacterium]
MSHPDEHPFSESHLESPAYRERLMRKLNCLIAVLEVACAKVRQSLSQPEADAERLLRIQKNLNETLEVCQRARRALSNREELPAELSSHLGLIGSDQALSAPVLRARSERPRAPSDASSSAEAERFAKLGPIRSADIRSIDFDALARMLQS